MILEHAPPKPKQKILSLSLPFSLSLIFLGYIYILMSLTCAFYWILMWMLRAFSNFRKGSKHKINERLRKKIPALVHISTGIKTIERYNNCRSYSKQSRSSYVFAKIKSSGRASRSYQSAPQIALNCHLLMTSQIKVSFCFIHWAPLLFWGWGRWSSLIGWKIEEVKTTITQL